MGLESHVSTVIEALEPDLLHCFWWEDGMNVKDKETAMEIMSLLDETNQFGPTTWDPKTKKIRFGIYKEKK